LLFLGGAVDTCVSRYVASNVGVLPGPSNEGLDEKENGCSSWFETEEDKRSGHGEEKKEDMKMECGNVPTQIAKRQSCSGSQ